MIFYNYNIDYLRPFTESEWRGIVKLSCEVIAKNFDLIKGSNGFAPEISNIQIEFKPLVDSDDSQLFCLQKNPFRKGTEGESIGDYMELTSFEYSCLVAAIFGIVQRIASGAIKVVCSKTDQIKL